ncbi:MAG: ROK family protein [Acidimicrobiia bacterium]|nr:ROK family protein [Acidimicrobiia bacterium]MDH5519595.1 ROK family protein [Acidimicrobiia bacterium]
MTAGGAADAIARHCTITVDLGGTNVRAAAVDDLGDLVLHIRRPTPRHDPDPQFLIHLIHAVIADLPADRRAGRAVVGLPGVIDQVHERLVTGVNLPKGWIDKINEDWIADQIGMEVSLANDADLAAVGESEFGAGRNHRDVVYVTVSTGVGAGLVVASRLVQGSLSGGELGHTVIDWEAARRGEPATVEDLGSGTAIDRAAAKAGLAERGADFAALVAAGSEPATTIWNHALEAVGIGIANMAWMVAPQIVIVGGGVGRNTDLVLPVIRRQLEQFGPVFSGDIELATAELGDDAALIGGAAWYRAIGRVDGA